jgi:hypothetical protein
MANTKPARPSNLGAKSRRVWDDITSQFDLRADELRVLEDCCREIDLIERLEQALQGSDLLVEGSMGQPVASPLVTEVRQHRGTLARLFASLKLPEDAGTSGRSQEERSSAARKAAQARWGTGKQRGA